MLFFTICILAAGIGMGLGVLGPGIGMGHAIRGALDGISRNPGVYNRIFTTMLIGLAIIESLAIYVLVICLMILFFNPYLKFIPEAAKVLTK